MTRIGLTGGIGSGKSSVSARLREHGAVVIDYDVLAREVVEPGAPALERLVERFGPEVLTPDGALDRPALGSIVFGDEQARRDLEGVLHPAVRALAAEREAEAGPDAVVVHDIPLLVETSPPGAFERVIVVDVPEEVQLDRLVRLRGMSEHEARARIASQATREQRLAAADDVVDNTGTLEDLDRAVEVLWAELA